MIRDARLPFCATLGLLASILAAPAPALAKKAAARPAPAGGSATSPAAALVDSVARRYRSLERFRFEGQLHAWFRSDTSARATSVDAPFLYAAMRPSKLRNEMRNPYMSMLFVSDGDSLFIAAPALHQFTAQAAPAILAGGVPADDFRRSLDPMGALSLLNQNAASVTDAGSDTVRMADGVHACRRIEIAYPPDSTRPGVTVMPRVLWIDEAARIIARDSSTFSLMTPQMGHVTSVQDTRFTVARPDDGGPDSLYQFHAPPGSRRVAQLGAPGTEPPDHSGEPAAEFTLKTLDGKPVTLSKLRGQIVVLDFWATWCGPCRRWMPIVARYEKLLQGKGARFFAVNLREDGARVRNFLTESKLTIPVLLDPSGSTGAAYGADAIPLTVVVGRDGKIVRTLVGLHPEEDLRAALEKAGAKGL